ncbi:MAG: hypothetical protein BIFFINMI_04193 [Phycisphaerae bacterium]|nr:hypothetical protein [Phycisphaerae bacterium]
MPPRRHILSAGHAGGNRAGDSGTFIRATGQGIRVKSAETPGVSTPLLSLPTSTLYAFVVEWQLSEESGLHRGPLRPRGKSMTTGLPPGGGKE